VRILLLGAFELVPRTRMALASLPGDTDGPARSIESRFWFLPTLNVFTPNGDDWLSNTVAGVQVHDARSAAAMLAHKIPRLLTLNARDLARYDGISVVHRREVVARVRRP